MDKTTVIVLGAPRGGTSLVAGVLRELGVFMGTRLGRNHEDHAFLTKDTEKLRSTVAARNKEHRVWGFKVPHTVFHLHKLEDVLVNPHYLVALRNPLAVARSQQRRTGAAIPTGLRVTAAYYKAVGEFLRDKGAPIHYVGVEEALASPGDTVREICSFLGFEVDGAAADRAISFISPTTTYRDIWQLRWQASAASEVPLEAERLRYPDPVAQNGHEIRHLRVRFPMSARQLFCVLQSRIPSTPSILLDVGEGFNHHTAQRFPLAPGHSIVRVEANSPIVGFGLNQRTDDGEPVSLLDVFATSAEPTL